jgi:hypothetical protein
MSNPKSNPKKETRTNEELKRVAGGVPITRVPNPEGSEETPYGLPPLDRNSVITGTPRDAGGS